MNGVRILVLYYSMYGNTFEMAKEVAAGVSQIKDAVALIKQVPDLIPESVIAENKDIQKAKELQKNIPVTVVDDLRQCDGLILGAPTRFGNMCAQMRNFLDQTGQLWQEGVLIGKPAGLFTSTATLHGGQETTLVSMMLTLLHHGMLVVGVPYSVQALFTTRTGGTPYGSSHVAGVGFSPLTEEEKSVSRALGTRVAEISLKLKYSKE